jgi:outer membrane receptor protein involved in Fe transport
MFVRRSANHGWSFALLCAVVCFIVTSARASEYHGQVTFGGLPLPGATVTVIRGDMKFSAITDQHGTFIFPDLADGKWTLEIQMQCFSTVQQDVAVGANAPRAIWELKLLPLDQIGVLNEAIVASGGPSVPRDPNKSIKPQDSSPPAPVQADENSQSATDVFLINGSVNNGAVSPFAQASAFGNARSNGNPIYHGGIGIRFDNSVLDARPFSFSGQSTPKASYNQAIGLATLGGRLKIPHMFERGPIFFVSYQWTRHSDSNVQSAQVPDLLERKGDFSHTLDSQGQPVQVVNPATGLPFPGNIVPVSPRAQALLNLYPLPNVAGNPRYNFQTSLLGSTHQDALQSRLDKTIGRKNRLYGSFAFESTRTSSPNLFGFLDKTDALGSNTTMNWWHRLNQNASFNIGYRFNRLATSVLPFWANLRNVSGEAGISGNNQDPVNWGPPTLVFSSGLADLSDGKSFSDRNQTMALSYALTWNHNRHNFTFGGDFGRQEFNFLSQQDPRGTLGFTGAATQDHVNGTDGFDFADFLLGIPDTSAIAFGNADKYFRQSVYSAYIEDDWRLKPQFSLNLGVRWEYGTPITELFDRLVNLDVAPGFAAVAPVPGSNPVGPLTGRTYPSSLVEPYKYMFEPRIGIAWRPLPDSSLILRAGYGVYSDTSIYQALALQLAQQSPLSKSLSVQNSVACPLTLANAFNACPGITPNTFAVDPKFRPIYAQTWQLSVQRDLPGSLQLTASYLGVKGTHGIQAFLPNTFPIGAVNPCLSCPAGFVYIVSGGNSTHESGQLQLRRRLHNGFTGSVQYTLSKSIDDISAFGGLGPSSSPQGQAPITPTFTGTSQGLLSIAQDWLNLSAERGPSTFDQRHLLSGQLQYTTGMGLGGGTLFDGWKGTLFKGWTITTATTFGSGLPEPPVFLAAVPGTGVTHTIRPDLTGASVHTAPAGLFLNPAAYEAPQPGEWGNAGRNSITGPATFTLNSALGRSFLFDGKYHLDFRVESINLLNKVTFTKLDTTINSTQFGLPEAANQMRTMYLSLNLRF